ncbi:FG-GAP-like repeat-containing protein [Cellvibrio sp. ARAG 10.3]|uniref:FG-GAP-like repeat-containing protein n=1 Tax=Cellvibrio sp. ARAG 10.3 TaxID=3451358 RepID=UPI003F4495FB
MFSCCFINDYHKFKYISFSAMLSLMVGCGADGGGSPSTQSSSSNEVVSSSSSEVNSSSSFFYSSSSSNEFVNSSSSAANENPNVVTQINYDVLNTLPKRVVFDISINAIYANVSIETNGEVLVDNIDVPTTGNHRLNALVNFDSIGEKEIRFLVRGSAAEITNITFTDVAVSDVPSFTDISSLLGLVDDPSLKYGGPSIADMNMNGNYDLILNNHNDSPSKLYWNNGNGTLTKAQTNLSLWKLMDLHGSAAGDYDNDGDLDLVIALGGGNGTSPVPPVFFRNDGGTLTRADAAIGITSGARGRSPRWGDFDLDGDLDLALINAEGINGETGAQHIFYRNKGDGTFELIDVAGLGYANSERTLFLDFNKDGIDDVLLLAPMSLWRGNGDFTFTNVTNEWLPSVVRGSHGTMAAADVDVNNDGHLDLYLAQGKGYYSVSDKSFDFNKASQRLDIRDKGDAAVITSMQFSAPGDIELLHFDLSIVTARYTGTFPIYLGEGKTPITPANREEIVAITQASAAGWPETRTMNGIYIGHTGDGEWQLEIVRDQFIAWSIDFSVQGISDVKTDWTPNNRNSQDILLINEGNRFVVAPDTWNLPKGGNHWGVTHGDFNNDSHNDIFVYRYGYLRERIADYILLNTGEGSFEILTSSDATHVGAVSHGDGGQAFDFDLDGDVDILSGDDEYGVWHLFQNDYTGTGNYTLVQVGYSPVENIDPIAAQVTVTTKNNTYYKRVGSAGESFSQSLINTIHLGLGDESIITSVSIRWRNGETVFLHNQDANKLLKSDDGEFPEPNVINITPSSGQVRVGVADIDLDVILDPINANPMLSWTSSNESVATVDSTGIVTGVSTGFAIITATSDANGAADSVEIEVVPFTPIPVEGITVSPSTSFVIVGGETSLTATLSPAKVDDSRITWSSSNDNVATVSANGVVRGIADGVATITATSVDGGFTDSSNLTVETFVAPSIAFDDEAKYRSPEFPNDGSIDVSVNYHAGTGNTLVPGVSGDGGVKFWLRELDSSWVPINDYVATDAAVLGTVSGVAAASISLNGVKPTAELPAGNFYYLFISMSTSDGEQYNHGIFPITIIDGGASNGVTVCSNAANLVSCGGNNNGEGADVSDWYAYAEGNFISNLNGKLSVSTSQANGGAGSIHFALDQAGSRHFIYNNVAFDTGPSGGNFKVDADVFGANLSTGTDYVIEVSFRPLANPQDSDTYKLWHRLVDGAWRGVTHTAKLPAGQYIVGFKVFSPGFANTLTLDYYIDNLKVTRQ